VFTATPVTDGRGQAQNPSFADMQARRCFEISRLSRASLQGAVGRLIADRAQHRRRRDALLSAFTSFNILLCIKTGKCRVR
jgi:hypothetical protein